MTEAAWWHCSLGREEDDRNAGCVKRMRVADFERMTGYRDLEVGCDKSYLRFVVKADLRFYAFGNSRSKISRSTSAIFAPRIAHCVLIRR